MKNLSGKGKKIQLKLPGQTDNLEIIREFVSKIARRVGFHDDDISKIELAVDEACANVVKHAYSTGDVQPIDITINVDDEKFVVNIVDYGQGFNPASIKKPDMKQYFKEMKQGGLGIHLMRTLMDEVHFEVDADKGNCVSLVKKFEQK